MTTALEGNYKCEYCGDIVTYYYPINTYYLDGEKWNTPRSRKYFKAIARFNHNQNHTGIIDKYFPRVKDF